MAEPNYKYVPAENELSEDDMNYINKHRPRHVFEMPASIMMTVKRNNELLEQFIKRMEAGINGPWLNASDAAKYIAVSKSHLLHNLRGKKIPSHYDPDGKKIIFHIDDLDDYWKSRRQELTVV